MLDIKHVPKDIYVIMKGHKVDGTNTPGQARSWKPVPSETSQT